jgi:hypothetical protein
MQKSKTKPLKTAKSLEQQEGATNTIHQIVEHQHTNHLVANPRLENDFVYVNIRRGVLQILNTIK